MNLTILGYSSALPTANNHPSSQLLNILERSFLIDCGEGTQRELRAAKIKFSQINHIFISHLHGDHVYGLIGLISTFGLLGRTKALHIYGPKGIKKLIKTQLEVTESYLNYEILFTELSSKKTQIIYEDDKVEVSTLPLLHRVYCNGYLFKEKSKARKLNISEIKKIPEIEICDYQNLKDGKDFQMKNGKLIPNSVLTYDPIPSYSYAYCSDTQYHSELIDLLENVDVVYHESTFLEIDKELAFKTGHSTAKDAAKIAHHSKIKTLILGHFSNRYPNLTDFLKEAQEVFPNTILPERLRNYNIYEISKNPFFLS